jgi:hypothetical protein
MNNKGMLVIGGGLLALFLLTRKSTTPTPEGPVGIVIYDQDGNVVGISGYARGISALPSGSSGVYEGDTITVNVTVKNGSYKMVGDQQVAVPDQFKLVLTGSGSLASVNSSINASFLAGEQKTFNPGSWSGLTIHIPAGSYGTGTLSIQVLDTTNAMIASAQASIEVSQAVIYHSGTVVLG